jgi:(p)ppGpp synthase/HD superfamily hydrolase
MVGPADSERPQEGEAAMRSEDLILGRRFVDALAFATEAHTGQFRKGTSIPYIAHPLSVAALVLTDGGNEDAAVAALLHDVLEDTDVTAEELEKRFGERVARIVEACSDTEEKPKPPWRQRKEAFFERLRAEDDEGVLRVEVADKLDNARAILRDLMDVGDRVWERFNAGREQQLWYYRSLAEAFTTRPDSSMVRELQDTVAEIERLAYALRDESGG